MLVMMACIVFFSPGVFASSLFDAPWFRPNFYVHGRYTRRHRLQFDSRFERPLSRFGVCTRISNSSSLVLTRHAEANMFNVSIFNSSVSCSSGPFVPCSFNGQQAHAGSYITCGTLTVRFVAVPCHCAIDEVIQTWPHWFLTAAVASALGSLWWVFVSTDRRFEGDTEHERKVAIRLTFAAPVVAVLIVTPVYFSVMSSWQGWGASMPYCQLIAQLLGLATVAAVASLGLLLWNPSQLAIFFWAFATIALFAISILFLVALDGDGTTNAVFSYFFAFCLSYVSFVAGVMAVIHYAKQAKRDTREPFLGGSM